MWYFLLMLCLFVKNWLNCPSCLASFNCIWNIFLLLLIAYHIR
jgi:hypothetical protein